MQAREVVRGHLPTLTLRIFARVFLEGMLGSALRQCRDPEISVQAVWVLPLLGQEHRAFARNARGLSDDSRIFGFFRIIAI
jgi:hypothetical protein